MRDLQLFAQSVEDRISHSAPVRAGFSLSSQGYAFFFYILTPHPNYRQAHLSFTGGAAIQHQLVNQLCVLCTSGSKLMYQLGRPLTVPARYLRPVQFRRPVTVPVWISLCLLQTKKAAHVTQQHLVDEVTTLKSQVAEMVECLKKLRDAKRGEGKQGEGPCNKKGHRKYFELTSDNQRFGVHKTAQKYAKKGNEVNGGVRTS
ncbi:heat shock protein 83-like [Dorcoceras hygrometricum]|uniref:Heat shock protein 83-like n=1 Tax=Dorcoceras hygrometricum TaxID=472368 RepID=A0A2Z7D7C1_9LAMI|nr:heat shock protein 83-like [Dorcoceras hygrometricum]